MQRTSMFEKTGFPMLDMFFDGCTRVMEMQLRTLNLAPRVADTFAAKAQAKGVETVQAVAKVEENIHHGSAAEAVDREEEEIIPILREELQVSKRRVTRGKTILVRANVRKVPVEREIVLRSETVFVEHQPTSETVDDDADLRERVIEVHETTEEPVIEKIVRQTGQYVIHREIKESKTTVREMLREMQVSIEGDEKHNTIVLETPFGGKQRKRHDRS